KETFRLDGRTVLCIDEAGMLGSVALTRLLEEAKRAGSRVILCGDPGQLQPVGECGAPLEHVSKKRGAATLETIIRQEDLEDRKAVEAYSRGETEAALRSFARRGKVTVTETRNEAVTKLVAAWARAKDPGHSLVFARTRREVEVLNLLCQ